MSLLIPGTNSIKDTGYNVANSLRFDDGSSDRLRRTPSSAGNRRTFTFSTWVKRSALGSSNRTLICATVDDANKTMLRFTDSDQLRFVKFTTSSVTNQLTTNAVFRDVSAWSHIVIAVDTTNSTAGDRLRLYVNGSEITSFSAETQPSLNFDYDINNTEEHNIGYGTDVSNHLFDGYMAETVLIDGQQLAPTSFGEFDEDSPNIWKPIDVSGLTFGTNGFHLDFENASSLGADVSGNSNNFTVNNLTSIDQSTDTCTNNFLTLNPLDMTESTGRTFSEGNLTYTSDSSNASSARGTFGVNTGKWYYEVKIVSQSGSASSGGKFGTFGFTDIAEYSSPATNGLTIISDSRLRGQGSTSGSSGSAIWGVGDILMFALDLDNQNLYMGKNGSWRASDGDFDDSSPSSAIFSSIDTTKFWTPFGQKNVSADNTLSYSMNFGSPSFSISSGNADGNGHGNFEYAVPSGYFSLCTKNLAESG